MSLINSFHAIKDKNLLVEKMRQWLNEQSKMNPRKDDEFLLIFLRSCDFDMELTKKTILKYYENKLKIPQWWRNRDLNDPKNNVVLNKKRIVALQETSPEIPTILLIIESRGDNATINYDTICKMSTIVLEKAARRPNSQNNGVIIIVDCRNIPLWIAPHLLSIPTLKNIISSFHTGAPIKLKKVIILDPPFIFQMICRLAFQFLPLITSEKFQIVSGDWSSMYEAVPLEYLPEEYGGQAGPLKRHEDAFMEELKEFNEYLLDDEQFGYKD